MFWFFLNPPIELPVENELKVDEFLLLTVGCIFVIYQLLKDGIFYSTNNEEEQLLDHCGRGVNAFSSKRQIDNKETKKEIWRPHLHDKNFKRYRRY